MPTQTYAISALDKVCWLKAGGAGRICYMYDVGMEGMSRSSEARLAARERVKKHRDALRARGLRPVQIWVPDTRRPGFAEEIERQCLSLKDDPEEQDIMNWLDHVRDTTGWV